MHLYGIVRQRIAILKGKKLTGKRIIATHHNNQMPKLWRSFRCKRNEIQASLGNVFYSVRKYPLHFFNAFDPNAPFEKWAAKEVLTLDHVPEGMETLEIHDGLYAVFSYVGPSTNHIIFEQIIGIWLPFSAFEMDCQPHFEVLGAKYKNGHPYSEKEIWIPIQSKT
jgi:AraC family transcriptional regulator